MWYVNHDDVLPRGYQVFWKIIRKLCRIKKVKSNCVIQLALGWLWSWCKVTLLSVLKPHRLKAVVMGNCGRSANQILWLIPNIRRLILLPCNLHISILFFQSRQSYLKINFQLIHKNNFWNNVLETQHILINSAHSNQLRLCETVEAQYYSDSIITTASTPCGATT